MIKSRRFAAATGAVELPSFNNPLAFRALFFEPLEEMKTRRDFCARRGCFDVVLKIEMNVMPLFARPVEGFAADAP